MSIPSNLSFSRLETDVRQIVSPMTSSGAGLSPSSLKSTQVTNNSKIALESRKGRPAMIAFADNATLTSPSHHNDKFSSSATTAARPPTIPSPKTSAFGFPALSSDDSSSTSIPPLPTERLTRRRHSNSALLASLSHSNLSPLSSATLSSALSAHPSMPAEQPIGHSLSELLATPFASQTAPNNQKPLLAPLLSPPAFSSLASTSLPNVVTAAPQLLPPASLTSPSSPSSSLVGILSRAAESAAARRNRGAPSVTPGGDKASSRRVSFSVPLDAEQLKALAAVSEENSSSASPSHASSRNSSRANSPARPIAIDPVLLPMTQSPLSGDSQSEHSQSPSVITPSVNSLSLRIRNVLNLSSPSSSTGISFSSPNSVSIAQYNAALLSNSPASAPVQLSGGPFAAAHSGVSPVSVQSPSWSSRAAMSSPHSDMSTFRPRQSPSWSYNNSITRPADHPFELRLPSTYSFPSTGTGHSTLASVNERVSDSNSLSLSDLSLQTFFGGSPKMSVSSVSNGSTSGPSVPQHSMSPELETALKAYMDLMQAKLSQSPSVSSAAAASGIPTPHRNRRRHSLSHLALVDPTPASDDHLYRDLSRRLQQRTRAADDDVVVFASPNSSNSPAKTTSQPGSRFGFRQLTQQTASPSASGAATPAFRPRPSPPRTPNFLATHSVQLRYDDASVTNKLHHHPQTAANTSNIPPTRPCSVQLQKFPPPLASHVFASALLNVQDAAPVRQRELLSVGTPVPISTSFTSGPHTPFSNSGAPTPSFRPRQSPGRSPFGAARDFNYADHYDELLSSIAALQPLALSLHSNSAVGVDPVRGSHTTSTEDST